MASYNRMKRADRDQEIADRKAEIAAVDAGEWPRNLNDEFRWNSNNARTENPPPTPAEYAKRLCTFEVEYLEGVQVRIEAGELPGWEA